MSIGQDTFEASQRRSVKSLQLLPRRFLFAFLGLALVASVTVVAGSQESASAQAELDTTMLLFDLSGSMGGPAPDGRSRLAVAQEAMIDAIGGIAPGSRNMGIRSFSDCGVTTLEQAPAPVDQTSLAATINSFTPFASTDIAVALSAVAGDLAGSSGRNTVILLSDGAHNCAGDPCQTAAGLIAAGIDVVVHAIGIGTAGTTAETQLSCIANVTGGTVVSIEGAEELFDAIDQAFDGGGTSALVEYRIPTCINSAMVQNDPALISVALGDPYRDGGGTARILVSGQQCDFNCNGGFDINCDGVLGDFCDSAFDLDTVHGVGQCLEQLGLDDGGESISEIQMLETHCVDSNSVGGLGLIDPLEIEEACRDYRDAKRFQRRADDAQSNGDASHGDYNQVLADDAFAKAKTVVDALCAAGPSDGRAERATAFDWRMNYRISGDDGLVLTNIALDTREMAERVSIPYLSVDTGESIVRIELMASPLFGDCPDATSRSRLTRSGPSIVNSSTLQIEAVYRIDQIEGLDGALTVTQRYQFDAELPGGQCEPSQVGPAPAAFTDFRILPCNPFRLTVDYDYAGSDAFRSIEIPQRFHFKVEGQSNNAATALLDRDSRTVAFLTFGNPIAGTLPFTFETIAPALLNGEQAPDAPFDNYHQTFRPEVSKPTGLPAAPGCPECVHIHWRWSNLITAPGYSGSGGPGSPLIPAGSTQSLNIGVSRFQDGELDPVSYEDVIDGQPVGIAGGDPVMWYISSSRAASDTFFDHQGVGGAFFSHSYVDLSTEVETPSEKVNIEDPAPVTVTVSNNGEGTATNVVVEVQFDSLLDVVLTTLPPNCEALAPTVGVRFECTYDQLAVNESRDFQFEVRNGTPGPFETVLGAKARSDQVEFSESNDIGTGEVIFDF